MSTRKNGVDWFLAYAANPDKLKIFFPEGDVRCVHCNYLYNEHGLNRCRCRITNEIIYYPESFGLPESCLFESTGEIRGTKPKKE